MSKDWEGALVGPDATIREALESIDRSSCRIAMVVDANRHLLGTITDGDARRALLKGVPLTDKVTTVMYTQPTVGRVGQDRHSALDTMRRLDLHQVPLLDDKGVVVGLQIIEDLLTVPTRSNWVVIMAGGLGSRLQELTKETPKPMLKVGSRPLLETIVKTYESQGFRNFYFAVNYKAEQIEKHFGDGTELGVRIEYLREQDRLGTAGALSLLPKRPTSPIVVTNADLLTKEDYGAMVDEHMRTKVDATMGVRDYEMQVPFGVVREGEDGIEAIEEKPIQRFVVNAGVCVLSPSVLDLVESGKSLDMPSLFDLVVKRGLRTRCHRIDGYWIDIGRLTDFERANSEFGDLFP